MTISPNNRFSKLRDVTPGTLILSMIHDTLRPCLIIGSAEGARDNKFVVQLFEEFQIFSVDDYFTDPVLVFQDPWRLRLTNELTPTFGYHSDETPSGKILLHHQGTLLSTKVIDRRTHMESLVTVSLENMSIIEPGEAYEGKKSFWFDWTLETLSDPEGSWRELSTGLNPADQALD